MPTTSSGEHCDRWELCISDSVTVATRIIQSDYYKRSEFLGGSSRLMKEVKIFTLNCWWSWPPHLLFVTTHVLSCSVSDQLLMECFGRPRSRGSAIYSKIGLSPLGYCLAPPFLRAHVSGVSKQPVVLNQQLCRKKAIFLQTNSLELPLA